MKPSRNMFLFFAAALAAFNAHAGTISSGGDERLPPAKLTCFSLAKQANGRTAKYALSTGASRSFTEPALIALYDLENSNAVPSEEAITDLVFRNKQFELTYKSASLLVIVGLTPSERTEHKEHPKFDAAITTVPGSGFVLQNEPFLCHR